MTRASPCVGTCGIDQRHGLCASCARTRDEIVAWKSASDDEIADIRARLPERRKAIGLRMHRLDWSVSQTLAFIGRTFRHGSGQWTVGVHGAGATFTIDADEQIAIYARRGAMAARTRRRAIAFSLPEDIRVIAFDPSDDAPARLVLARCRSPKPLASGGLSRTAIDREAIALPGAGETLYDLGIDGQNGSFGIRTAEPDLQRGLDAHVGRSWRSLDRGLRERMTDGSQTRVVRSAIGRIEITAAATAEEDLSAVFDPAALATKRRLPPSLELPRLYTPCAVFAPALPELAAW